jgi:hypothetical protein
VGELRGSAGSAAGIPGRRPVVSERHIWVLIGFSLWYQIYVERAYDPIALGWEKVAGGHVLTRPGVSN